MDTQVTNRGRPVPVVAFLGTRGGVGTTTISRRFAELVTLAPRAPNVLLVDSAVFQGITTEVSRRKPISCPTVHDHVAAGGNSTVEAMDLTALIAGAGADSGRLYFLPAGHVSGQQIYEDATRFGPELLLQILHRIIASAVERYDCACVVIGCAACLDQYTAASTMLADYPFIVGRNDPMSASALSTYPDWLRDFYPEFSGGRLQLVLNRVPAWKTEEVEKQALPIFATMPDYQSIVEISEGLRDGPQVAQMLFEDHIAQLVARTFRAEHPQLVPSRKRALPERWRRLVDRMPLLGQLPPMSRLAVLRLLLPLGLLVLLAGLVVFGLGSNQASTPNREAQGVGIALGGVVLSLMGLDWGRRRRTYLQAILGVQDGGVEWMLEEMKRKRSARKTFDELLRIAGRSSVPISPQ